jgi:hypothetical protein
VNPARTKGQTAKDRGQKNEGELSNVADGVNQAAGFSLMGQVPDDPDQLKDGTVACVT